MNFSTETHKQQNKLTVTKGERINLEAGINIYILIHMYMLQIMASGPITSWEINGKAVATVADLIFWGSKITADDDCSYEIKSCLLLGRKVMTNLDSIFKSRDIKKKKKQRHYFANKGPSSQGYGFSSGHVWM